MDDSTKQNANPVVYAIDKTANISENDTDLDSDSREAITSAEIFDIIRGIKDPEHPLTLEQLHVVSKEQITVDEDENYILIRFTPTIPHCSMATLIGLCIQAKLHRSIHPKFRRRVEIHPPESHVSQAAINKQLNDKERVAAALENSSLLDVVNKCVMPSPESFNS